MGARGWPVSGFMRLRISAVVETFALYGERGEGDERTADETEALRILTDELGVDAATAEAMVLQ